MQAPAIRPYTRLAAPLLLIALVAGCQTHPSMPTVDRVDLDRFMGDWYVIANIPTFIERNAYNAVERYSRNEDGTVDTVFTFNRGGFDGPQRRLNPTGYVVGESGAEWRMQFVWPFRAEFLVVYLDEDYTRTVIGRSRRDYVWIMAREPELDDEVYEGILQRLDELGYDTAKVQRVPQRWNGAAGAGR